MGGVLPSDLTLGTTSTIGRYFALVSVVPSLLLTAWLYLVYATGALTGSPHLSHVSDTVRQDQPGQGLALAAVALVIAVISHPLQFAMVQLLEGYWGATAFGRAMQRRLAAVHAVRLGRAIRAQEAAGEITDQWEETDFEPGEAITDGSSRQRRDVLGVLIASTAASARRSQYPTTAAHIMATRLGNTLRRYEMLAGAAYKLPILTFATHLGMVAEAKGNDYVRDQRNQMDLASRMCVSMLVAAFLSSIALWPHGWWLLWTLAPYTAAWMSYRGAVSAAASYGQALLAWSDLNRFALYKALNLAPVANSNDEREQNQQLALMVAGDDFTSIYTEAPAPATTDTSAPVNAGWLRRLLHG